MIFCGKNDVILRAKQVGSCPHIVSIVACLSEDQHHFNLPNIKIIRRLITWLVWLLVGTLATLLLLLHLPAVQGYLGTRASEIIGDRLGTTVKVGSIDLGFLNRIIIDDFAVADQQGQPMLSATRLSAKVELTPLLQGRISVSSAQVFGLKAILSKATADSPLNIQFVLDSLASDSSSEHTPLDLNINSLVVRNGAVSYDQLDIPATPGLFCPQHIAVSGLSGHLTLQQLTDDLIDLKVKRLALHEASGIDLRRLTLHLQADRRRALVTQLALGMGNSSLEADTLEANYQWIGDSIVLPSLTYRGQVDRAEIHPSDFSAFLPRARGMNTVVNLATRFSGTTDAVSIPQLNIRSTEGFTLSADGSVSRLRSVPRWLLRIGRLDVTPSAIDRITLLAGTNIPEPVRRLGRINYVGEVGGDGDSYAMRGHLATDAGQVSLTFGLRDKHLTGHAETDGFQLGSILDENQLGTVATTIDIDGQLPLGREMTMLAKGVVRRLDFNGHTYNNITIDGFYDHESFDGTLGIDDPNGLIGIEGKFNLSAQSPSATISASARHFTPEALGIAGAFLRDHTFDADITTNITGNLDNLEGTIDIDHLTLTAPGKNYHLEHLHIDADNSGTDKHFMMNSDFGEVNLNGQYDLAHAANSILRIVKNHLPSLPLLTTAKSPYDQRFTLTADIDRSDWLKTFTDLDLTINSPLHVDAQVDETEQSLSLTCLAPSIEYNDGDYRDINLTLVSSGDTLKADGSLVKMQESGKGIDLVLQANAAHDMLSTDVAFDNHGGSQRLRGSLASDTQFLTLDGRPTANVHINSSQIFLNGMPWNVEPSTLQLAKGRINIDDFTVKNGDQHIIIAGSLTDNPTDTIHADLNRIDMAFFSNIVHINGIDFGGHITGGAYVTSVYDTPEAQADLYIDNFQFVDGRIGDMNLKVAWDGKDKCITLNGLATDGTEGTTDIDGYVQLEEEKLNLNINAHGTPLHFLMKFCDSFMSDISARVDGNVCISGPLDAINMEGKVVANGPVTLSSLNTTYMLRNDTVRLVPDHILFSGDSIFDRDGHVATVSGSIDHENMSDFTFGLDINARNLLAYDFPDFGDDTFCGTVYATGDCHIRGVSGEVTIDVNATPERGTVFYYNAAGPDLLSRQDFIQWNDVTPEAIDYSDLPSASKDASTIIHHDDEDEEAKAEEDIPSNLRMNFQINATPDAALRLLMDTESGDYIALYGNGTLRASYFNKGAFNLYGNYVVDHGIYKLTIQNVIKKEFQFQQGGTLAFAGDPYDAALDLKAIYTVNSVPLSDLNIGQSFAVNNIRVNCIMNILGTPAQPTVDFDMEMPTVNSDAQQMVRSIINSEDELNQQVVYLLAIGRFYNQSADALTPEGQSQTSLAMQSLLSGTISQQINNVINSFVKTSNWNFGANISTGNEGFNNAEYEGLLSGRLLNNRLLINGQFGYRDNPNATTSFIGDFDIRYLLYPNGNLAVKVYNQTNDRYFVKNSLNTQGIGLIMKKDFNGWRELLNRRKKKKND